MLRTFAAITKVVSRKLITLLVPVLAIVTGLGLAAPAASQAAVTVQRLGYCGGDDWEPAMASDSRHVYVLITHYAGNPTLRSRLRAEQLADHDPGLGRRRQDLQRPAVVAATPGGINYPSRPTRPSRSTRVTGAIYVSLLAYGLSGGHTDIYVAKSTNFGQSFSQAVQANGKGCKNCDHEKILASNNVVYDAYTQGSSHFVVGLLGRRRDLRPDTSWTALTVVGFAEGGVFDSHGNAWFAWGDCQTSNCTGAPAADYRVSETLPGRGHDDVQPGRSRSHRRVPTARTPIAASRSSDRRTRSRSTRRAPCTWPGRPGRCTTQRQSPTIINLSRCSSNCTTAAGWSLVGRVDDKTAANCPNSACYALFPNIVAAGPGQLFATWMDDRNDSLDGTVDHVDGYNLWYRASTNGGTTWTTPGQQISQFDPAQSQSTPNGFLFPYGDYTGLIMNTTCQTPAPAMTWGEGHNWIGGATAPGHIEFASLC